MPAGVSVLGPHLVVRAVLVAQLSLLLECDLPEGRGLGPSRAAPHQGRPGREVVPGCKGKGECMMGQV